MVFTVHSNFTSLVLAFAFPFATTDHLHLWLWKGLAASELERCDRIETTGDTSLLLCPSVEVRMQREASLIESFRHPEASKSDQQELVTALLLSCLFPLQALTFSSLAAILKLIFRLPAKNKHVLDDRRSNNWIGSVFERRWQQQAEATSCACCCCSHFMEVIKPSERLGSRWAVELQLASCQLDSTWSSAHWTRAHVFVVLICGFCRCRRSICELRPASSMIWSTTPRWLMITGLGHLKLVSPVSFEEVAAHFRRGTISKRANKQEREQHEEGAWDNSLNRRVNGSIYMQLTLQSASWRVHGEALH